MKIFSIRSYQQKFENLIKPHTDHMYRLAYRFCLNQEDAEDLVQDVIVKLYAKKMDLDEVDNLKPWLGKIIYRQFIDNVRRRSRSPIDSYLDESIENSMVADMKEQPDQILDREYSLNEVENAFAKLNDEQRAVIALHDVEGYSLKDIETIMGTPIGTLKSRLHRARAKIKQNIEQE